MAKLDSGGGFLDSAKLDHLVGHVHHSLVNLRVDDTQLFRGAVVEQRDVLVGVGIGEVLGDGPAERSVLGGDCGGVLLEGRRSDAQEEASVCGGCVRDTENVSSSDVTDVDEAAVLGTDLVHAALHESLHPASTGESFFAHWGSHDEGGADRDNLKLLGVGESSLEVPGGLLSKNLGLGVVAQSFGAVWITPVGFVVGAVSRLVCSGRVLDRGNTRCDDAALDGSLLAGLHDESGAIYSRLDEGVGIVTEEEG